MICIIMFSYISYMDFAHNYNLNIIKLFFFFLYLLFYKLFILLNDVFISYIFLLPNENIYE